MPHPATPTVAFVGAKGGTLKSACTLSVGAELARQGRRVVLVDCDPQGTTTRALPDVQPDGSERPVRIVPDPLAAPPVAVHLEPVRAGGGALAVFRAGPLLWKARRDDVLRHLERAKAGADLVLVDTVPVLGDLTLAAAAAADLVVVPTAPTADDLDAVDHVVAAIQESVDPDKAFRVVVTKAIAGRRNTRDAVQLLGERYGARLYPITIPHRTAGETANMYLRPAVLYDEAMGDGALAAAYRQLAALIAHDVGLGRPAARPAPRPARARARR